MRKLWRRMPGSIRWFLVTLVTLAIVAGAAYTFQVLTITGEVTVVESINIVEPRTFSVTLKPNESDVRTFTVTNSSSARVEVTLKVTVSPSGQGVVTETSPDDNLTVLGNGNAQFTLTTEAENDVVPQTYTVTVGIHRE